MNRKTFAEELNKLKQQNFSTNDLDKIAKSNAYHGTHTTVNENRKLPLRKTPDHYAILVFIEELTEFIQELTKWQNHHPEHFGILEEITDVYISAQTIITGLQLPDSVTYIEMKCVYQYISHRQQNDYIRDTILCCTRVQQHLIKYLRNLKNTDINKNNDLLVELNNLFFLLEVIKTHRSISDEEIILTEYIKFNRYINRLYHDPNFVPDDFLLDEHIVEFNDETALGEPTAWIYLTDDTYIEITHEENGLDVPFFSIRRHCSDKDFENDTFHKTCGIMDQYVADDFAGTLDIVQELLNNLKASDIFMKTE